MDKELLYFQKTYNVSDFVFTDSLINGSMKHFKQFIQLVAEHNKNSDKKITWSSQYISRNELRTLKDPDTFFKLLADSGVEGLTIGAETFSNRALDAMNKKTTVEALLFELEYFRKYGINCKLLTFCGHWSETHEEYVKHCQTFVKLIPYFKSGTISSFTLGVPYVILPDTPSYNNINLIKDKKFKNLWIHRDNRTNTYKTRLNRRLVLTTLLEKLNIPPDSDEGSTLTANHEFLKSYTDIINEFYEKYADKTKSDFIANGDSFVDEILNYKKTLDISLVLETSSDPSVTVQLKDNIIHQGILPEGVHRFNFSIDVDKLSKTKNQLLITMDNKNPNDTVVDSSGKIIKDKTVLVKYLMIDNCILSDDLEFMYNGFEYINQGNRSKGQPGLWSNQTLCLEFDLPFVVWYSFASKKNTQDQWSEESKQSFKLPINSNEADRLRPIVLEQLKNLKY